MDIPKSLLHQRALTAARTGDVEALEGCFLRGLKLPVDNHNPDLIYAADQGSHKAIFEVLAAQGWDLNTRTEINGCSLATACRAANADLVRFLLSHGVDPNQAAGPWDEYNTVGLAIDAEGPGALQTLKVLMTEFAPVRTKGEGYVLCAVEKGSLEALKVVVEHGDGGVNETVEYSWSKRAELTPLYAAARMGDVEKTRYLLGKGADPAWKDAEGKTARQVAEENGFVHVMALFEDEDEAGTS